MASDDQKRCRRSARSLPEGSRRSIVLAVTGRFARPLPVAAALALAAALTGPGTLAAQGGGGGAETVDRSKGAAPDRSELADTVVAVDPVRLPPLTVEASRAGKAGKTRGFERRRRLHPAGVFVGRAEIERRDPRLLSNLLRGVAGVTPSRSAGEVGRQRIRMDRTLRRPAQRPCRVRYFVDGQPLPKDGGFRIDALDPDDVEGIEVYRGVSEVPLRFQRREDRCGVVVIWTRVAGGGRR